MVLTRVEDQGIRGGDFIDDSADRFACARVGSDNPNHAQTFYGFRTFLPSRLPLQERGST